MKNITLALIPLLIISFTLVGQNLAETKSKTLPHPVYMFEKNSEKMNHHILETNVKHGGRSSDENHHVDLSLTLPSVAKNISVSILFKNEAWPGCCDLGFTSWTRINDNEYGAESMGGWGRVEKPKVEKSGNVIIVTGRVYDWSDCNSRSVKMVAQYLSP